MPSVCATPFKLAAMRFTLLNSCGVPVVGNSSSISVTGSVIEVAETAVWEDQEEFFTKNGVGQFCTKDATAPIYKYSDLQFTLCNTDPDLVNFASAQSMVLDDSTTPQDIGFRTEENASALVNMAVEGWTLLTNKASCSTGFQYGYLVWPWTIQGQIQDVTYGNSTVSMVIKVRTNGNSPWGTGPYNVNLSNATTTAGLPLPLLTSFSAQQHRDWHLTALPPPIGACGAGPLTFTLAPLTGLVHNAPTTLTFPTPALLPAMINWGDTTPPTLVTTGTTVQHTYTAAGTFAVTYNTLGSSHAPYTASVTLT